MNFSSETWLAVGIALLAATSLVSVLILLLVRESRNRDYDDARRRAELDVMRKSFEEQIYRLTERLTSTDARWRDVNHLLIAGQQIGVNELNTKQVPRLEFLKRAGLDDSDFVVDRKLVFVLTPFHPDFQQLYDSVNGVCRAVGLTCMRGDEEHVSGVLLAHILKLIVRARLIIAIVDGRNPNVFYELGVAHSLNKPVLIVAKSHEDVPFDVRNTRIIFYTNVEQLSSLLTTELTKTLVAD